MRRFLILLPVLLLAACSSDEDLTPTAPPTSSIPTIGGTYSSDTMWHFAVTSANSRELTCSGGVTVQNQVGSSFSGIFFVTECSNQPITGTVSGGTVQADGAISFELTLPGPEPTFMSAAFGCKYVSGDRVVIGTLVNNQLTAQSTTVMDCDDGQNTLVMRLSGTR